MKLELLTALNEERAARRAAVVVTVLASGEQRLVKAGDVATDPLRGEIEKRLRSGKSGTEETADGNVFLTVFAPPLRLVVTGAVHISQELAPIAQRLGFDVTIIDPRTAFATEERFAGIKLLAEWPDKVLPGIGVDAHTAFVALTHDPKIDDVAIRICLRQPVAYLGALGSRTTQAQRKERLLGDGFTVEEVERIRGPVGLAIGAKTPAEIALSILAEMIQVRRAT